MKLLLIKMIIKQIMVANYESDRGCMKSVKRDLAALDISRANPALDFAQSGPTAAFPLLQTEPPVPSVFDQKSDSWAVFVQGTWNMTNTARFTGGLTQRGPSIPRLVPPQNQQQLPPHSALSLDPRSNLPTSPANHMCFALWANAGL